MKINKTIITLTLIATLFSQLSFAGRFGGGKSFGMKRSIPNSAKFQPSPAAIQNNAAPKRAGMGAGTAAALGVAAGAAGGYMLGKSMNNNNTQTANASEPQVQAVTESHSDIPWGTIGILALLLMLGLAFFKKNKTSPGFLTGGNPINPNNQNNMQIPSINRNTNFNQAQAGRPNLANAAAAQNMAPMNMEKMPDGVEKIYFLRQVKGMFLHIQSMNNLENLHEIQKYMTPELYQEIQSSISNNNCVADFSNLDCQLLNSEVVNNQIIASVKFYGSVSEDPQQSPKPFSEIWNFVKYDINSTKWLVAGIQQETLN
jgi:predicted lipid-binding transport protein (Tim44 family)